MKNIIKLKKISPLLGIFLVLLWAASCEDWTGQTEKKGIQTYRGKSNPPYNKYSAAYLENLRAYKKSNHQLAFGWMGEWSAKGTYPGYYLSTLPDSMDLVSIWGDASIGLDNFTLDEGQEKDLANVQNKGTRVMHTITIFSPSPADGKWFGLKSEDFSSEEQANNEKIRIYARSLVDSINKYNFDGLDIDYEAVYDNSITILVEELGKYLGPKSGTDKLLTFTFDSSAISKDKELGKYFNYFIGMTYWGRSPQVYMDMVASLDNFDSKKYIVTEDFEKYPKEGGNFLDLAIWIPSNTQVKGGVGAYNIQKEYDNHPNFKRIRKAIQMLNPSPVKINKTLKK